jgi:hypothetical protein
VAWLCLGPVRTLQATPDLERHGWRHRIPLAHVVHEEQFGRNHDRSAEAAYFVGSRMVSGGEEGLLGSFG